MAKEAASQKAAGKSECGMTHVDNIKEMPSEIEPFASDNKKRKFAEMKDSDLKINDAKIHYDLYKFLVSDIFCPQRTLFENALTRNNNNSNIQELLYNATAELQKYAKNLPATWSYIQCRMYMYELVED